MKNILILFALISVPIFAEQDTTSAYKSLTFDEFISRIKYSKKIDNKYLIEFSYGYSNFQYPHNEVKSELSNVFHAEISYGFVRFEPDFKGTGFIRYSSETVFLGNYSSHMGFNPKAIIGKTTDNWRFGFGFSNGYGYDLNKYGNIILYHSGKLTWAKIDFENPGETPEEQKRFDYYDERYKFGTSFGSGIRYSPLDYISINAGYEHIIYFPKFLGFKWMSSFFVELLAQRTIDYFGEDYFNEFHGYFPIVNFLVKNSVSLIFYEGRRKSMNWFYDTAVPINYDGIKFGITYIF